MTHRHLAHLPPVNCEKTSILVDSVVSSISVTKSPNFAIQITGVCPTIQLDSTDVGQIYLSKDSLAVEITTAKCSSINVSLPVEGEEEGVFGDGTGDGMSSRAWGCAGDAIEWVRCEEEMYEPGYFCLGRVIEI